MDLVHLKEFKILRVRFRLKNISAIKIFNLPSKQNVNVVQESQLHVGSDVCFLGEIFGKSILAGENTDNNLTRKEY